MATKTNDRANGRHKRPLRSTGDARHRRCLVFNIVENVATKNIIRIVQLANDRSKLESPSVLKSTLKLGCTYVENTVVRVLYGAVTVCDWGELNCILGIDIRSGSVQKNQCLVPKKLLLILYSLTHWIEIPR